MPKLSEGLVLVTDQRRADIYERLLISEDKRVIEVKHLNKLIDGYSPFLGWTDEEKDFFNSMLVIVNDQQERTI